MLALQSGLYLCVSLLTAVSLSCVDKSKPASPEIPPVQNQAAGSPSINLKEIWTEKSEQLNHKYKNYPKDRLELLLTLLDNASEEQVKNEMEALRADSRPVSEFSEYEQTLLEAFVTRGIRQQNSQMLVYLISAKCPRYISVTPLELYLALSNLQDPLQILFESYEKSVNDDARKTLLETLSHVCALSREDFRDDKDYVSAVEDWYLKNKDHIKPTTSYMPYSYMVCCRILFVDR